MLTIPKDLATWLIENFDPASNTSKLSDNRILEKTEEDVHATLALLMGLLGFQVALTCEPKNEYTKLLEQWRTRWNRGRTGTPKVGVNQIPNYNWCAYLLQCLNDTIVECKQNHTRYFRRPLLFLMGNPNAMNSLIKRTHTTINSPTYNDEQECLDTTMNTVVDIAMQYSNLVQHKAKGKKDNSKQTIEDELPQI
ncbi:hypothetical protein Cgig2_025259 [Carnegiea gigantea]|uniref:Uncharacterized protein n=1 Tax=Carnegiea gigantea TaxID=171969 RepID=A0A9Q1JPG5_9CARY|nr:hypothetical protein Cgig2_025259 [Carnegiea gigantea]